MRILLVGENQFPFLNWKYQLTPIAQTIVRRNNMRFIFVAVIVSMMVAFMWRRNRRKKEESTMHYELIQTEYRDNQDNDEQKKIQELEKLMKTKKNKIETSDMIPFAKNVKKELETKYVLGQNNSAKVQYALATTRNLEVQSYLLKYDYLKAGALITICEKPAAFNFDDLEVQELFTDAIERVKLKKEHEVRLFKNKNYIIKKALLKRANLSYECFLEICKNPKNFGMQSEELEEKLEEILIRLLPTLSNDEKFELAKTKMDFILKVLIE